ncbi:MAG: hypothetical protein ACOYKA_00170 [Legionellaceae bacterium]
MIEKRSVDLDAHLAEVLSDFLDESLSVTSVLSLKNLCARNMYEFDHLLRDLKTLVSPEGGELRLTAAHVDTILTLLDEQMRLPEKSMERLETLFAGRADRQISMIQSLTANQGVPHLEREAEKHHLLYHISAHGRAVMTRALYVLKMRFGFFDSLSDSDRGLEALLGFIFQFHDLDQVSFVETTSLETLTAARLNASLIYGLDGLVGDREMQAVVGYLCQHVIVRGTAVIHSSKSMCDLHQIFFRVETAYRNAGFAVVAPSNVDFVRRVKIIVLACSASDKNAASIQTLAGLEALTDPKTEAFYARIKTLATFFEKGNFTFYYPRANRKINERAFLMTLVQHISMCFEVPAKRGNRLAIAFVNFIQCCHQQLAKRASLDDFIAWLEHTDAGFDLRGAVEAMFFSELEKETSFSRGQAASLSFINSQLNALTGVHLVDPNVPLVDANNLEALKAFYDDASEDIKNKLCFDLAQVLMLQTGVKLGFVSDSIAQSRDIIFASQPYSCGNMGSCLEDAAEPYVRK